MADQDIINEIAKSIDSINYGSIEIIVQNRQVTQISTRIIKKTNTKHSSKNINNMAKDGKTNLNVNFKY
jgi:hypothetical protein